ncbi:MAG TPA: solute carrier family 23 protein [Burkholderiaceae bacterium]|nr:solute carrier family 23 protein [Burkholderiaceae bacterium]
MASPFSFKLPSIPTFRRPPNLVYSVNEVPPPSALAILTAQHVVTALAFVAYALAIAQIGGLDPTATRQMVTASILAMAVGTFLQAWGGGVGSGSVLVHIPSPLIISTAGMVVAQYGIGGMVLVGLVHGVVALLAANVVPLLRTVLTPAVAGVVICLAGISLITPSIEHVSGLATQAHIVSTHVIIGLSTLGVIIGLSVWGSHYGKLFALLAGLVTGLVLSAVFNEISGAESLAHTPLFSLPHIVADIPAVDAGVLIAVGILALLSQLDTFGSVVLMHKMSDADWRRPNMKLVSGGMRSDALAILSTTFLGAQPTSTSSANVALCHISRSTSRSIGIVAALLLAVCALLPKVAVALTLVPTPVIGAIGVYAAAYLIVSGLELITSRALDARGIFMVGLAFIVGMGIMFMPELAETVPESLEFMVSNGIVMGGITAILLNLLFRLGSAQRVSRKLDPENDIPLSEQVINFVESQGAHWNARRDVIARAASAALEAIEALLATDNRKPLAIEGSFDEHNFDISIVHQGAPLSRPAHAQPMPADLLDLDDDAYLKALDQALANASHGMLNQLADKTTTGVNPDDTSWLNLHFDH